jgi:gamma-glutamyltranspeptidase/glutathione hydrolase
MRRLYLLILILGYSLIGMAAATPKQAAIASAHPLATQAGVEILQKGGNAFDAAVAVSAALAVVEPYSSGIGGGGFWLLHRAQDNYDVMIDGREKAPLAAHPDLYVDDEGKVISGLSVDGVLAAGIPGEPAALAHIAAHYGRLPLNVVLAPAIKLAEEGFEVSPLYRTLAGFRVKALQLSKDGAAIFLQQGEIPALKSIIKQPDLANTLRLLARYGHDGFYKGNTANKLVNYVKEQGGIWSLEDLAQYQIVERSPIKGKFKGFEIISAPPPSSGGIALVEMLNILAHFEMENQSKATQTHLMVEAMRRAYRDRAEYLGDSDYVEVPVEKLTHPLYAAGLAQTINKQNATPSYLLPDVQVNDGANDTTHFSIIDKEGNYVSATLSINYPFGSGVVATGTGVLLNDEMDDFSAKPGVPNVYGLVGAEANAIESGKRMLSSMSPSFVKSDQGVALIGTPGGSRIITMVLLGMFEHFQGKDVNAWVSRPRFHHQYLPDKVFYEKGSFSDAEIKQLNEFGHQMEEGQRTWGNMQAIYWNKQSGEVSAASDPRGEGFSEVLE